MILERVAEYKDNSCWQYHIRAELLDEDMTVLEYNKEYLDNLRVADFDFVCVTDKLERGNITKFIKRYEWLGTLSLYTTHWYACYHKGIMAGAILFNMPNAFSKLLGEDTKYLERLISRGACASWTPKNLASAFLMWSINHMTINTQYRLFTAYSDPMAKELGTIYQACSFLYLGQKAGTTTRYINPYTGKVVSDRFFRVRSAYKKYAKELNIEWQKGWNSDTKMLWDNIPNKIEAQLRAQSKLKQATSEKIVVPSKHKYAFVKGRNKKETKELRKLFATRNKLYDYPKERGV